MNPTGSSLARAHACPASHALPRVETTSDAAERGNAAHEYLAIVAEDPAAKTLALRAAPEALRGALARIDVASALHGLARVRTETAYAFNVDTGEARLLGVKIGRRYGELAPSEIACTLDVEAMRDGRAVAKDWKTGQSIGDVEDAWQLKLQGLCLRSAFGVDEVEASASYLDLEADGVIVPRDDVHVFDALDLDAAHDELRSILARVRDAERIVASGKVTTTQPGDHCKYCASFEHCPAQTALVKAMAFELDDLAAKVDALSLEATGAAWTKLTHYKRLAKKVEDAIKARALRDGAIPLPSGKVLKMIDVAGRTTLDKDAALAAMKAAGIDGAQFLRQGEGYTMAKEMKP